MDYQVNLDENQIFVEVINMEKNEESRRERLLAYYVAFLSKGIHTNLSDDKKKELLSRIAGALTNDALLEVSNKMSNIDEQKKIIDTVQELVEAYEDEDFDADIVEVINGNKYTFDKSINIDEYREDLMSIGNQTSGNSWRVEIDDDGKVVLHE